jgi:hypothetical protein
MLAETQPNRYRGNAEANNVQHHGRGPYQGEVSIRELAGRHEGDGRPAAKTNNQRQHGRMAVNCRKNGGACAYSRGGACKQVARRDHGT